MGERRERADNGSSLSKLFPTGLRQRGGGFLLAEQHDVTEIVDSADCERGHPRGCCQSLALVDVCADRTACRSVFQRLCSMFAQLMVEIAVGEVCEPSPMIWTVEQCSPCLNEVGQGESARASTLSTPDLIHACRPVDCPRRRYATPGFSSIVEVRANAVERLSPRRLS